MEAEVEGDMEDSPSLNPNPSRPGPHPTSIKPIRYACTTGRRAFKRGGGAMWRLLLDHDHTISIACSSLAHHTSTT